MTIAEIIPLTPQPWCRNPEGYVRHQKLLVILAEWLEAQSIPLELPLEEESDRDHDDHGVDLIVSDTRIDLKSFPLEVYSNSLTWSSTYYKGRLAPLRRGLLTEWFVHPNGDDVSRWYAAPLSSLRTSKYGYQPYYIRRAVVTVAELVQDVFTSPSF